MMKGKGSSSSIPLPKPSSDSDQPKVPHRDKISTADLDKPLHAIGFEYDFISADRVAGRLTLTEICCQPFGVLHGGISALISEALASNGAHIASGFKRVAGIQLCVNHLKTAQIGDRIIAEATPVSPGKTIQVWKVQLWKDGRLNPIMVASSTVTLYCQLPVPDAGAAAAQLKKYAKL